MTSERAVWRRAIDATQALVHWRVRPRPTPIVLQAETSECGLACLVMVAAQHGSTLSLLSARNIVDVSARGASLFQLQDMACRLGLAPRPMRVDLPTLHELRLPCILHWDFEHFVVLTGIARQVATLHDPAQGRVRMPLAELSRHFTGVALELRPGGGALPAATSAAASRSVVSTVWPELRSIRSLLAPLLGLTIALQAATLLAPLQLRWLVDDCITVRDLGWIGTLAIGFGALTLLQVLLTGMRGWIISTASARLQLGLFTRVVERLFALPMPWFQKRNVADVLSRLDSVRTIQGTLTTGLVETLVDASLLLLSLGMMAALSPLLAVLPAAAALCYVLLRCMLYQPTHAATAEVIAQMSKRNLHLIESIRGMQTIKLTGLEANRVDAVGQLTIGQLNSGLREQTLRLWGQAAVSMLFGMENIATLSLGAYALAADMQAWAPATLGALIAFISYRLQFTQRAASVVDRAFELRLLSLHGERLADILDHAGNRPDLPAERPHDPVAATQQCGSWGVALEGVTFAYSSVEEPVLQRASLTVADGECLAIVGRSGCGKSTLLKLMLGLLQPSEGSVRLGDAEHGRTGSHRSRGDISCVMQDDVLFSGTLAQNISLFDMPPDEAAIRRVAKQVGLQDEVSAMPMGYHTRVGDGGNVLSGGQRQRVLLARALYRRPKLLLLDEATSHLDVASERLIAEAVRSLGITRIMVAHRPQTIASADRIVELRDGQLVPYRGDGFGSSAGGVEPMFAC